MNIIKPNLPLIKKVQLELNEITNISLIKNYDKDIAQDKIKSLIKDLTELNIIQKETLENYKKKNEELFLHMENQLAELTQITNTIGKYTEWNEKYFEFLKNRVEIPEEFLNEGKKYEKKIEAATKNPNPMNHSLIEEVLSTYIQIKFTKIRKRSIWWNYQIFRLNIFYRSILNVMISTLIGYSIEKGIGFLLPEIPEFIITIIITLLIFFTLEKFLGKKFNSYFWNLIQKQSFKLNLELIIYLKQIKLID